MRRLLAILSFVGILVALFDYFPAYAASSPLSKVRAGKSPINVIADSMTYDRDTGVYTAEGNVEIHQLKSVLQADVVEFDREAQVARAEGNVVYQEDGDTLECEFMEMNLVTKEGVVSGGKFFYKKENLYLKGRQVERLGENRYRIIDGDITTCNGERPSWKFKCKEADITLEGLAKVKGASFRIRDYPVLYFPYLVYPVRTKRASGFLLPSVGNSNREGVSFDNAYYWAISPNTDATAYLDVATKKGVGYGGEYRYISSETDRGRLYGYFIEERGQYQREKYTNLLDRGQDRWNVVYQGKKDFYPDLFARCKVDLVSDRQYYSDYGKNHMLRVADRTESTAFLTKHWEGVSLVGDVKYNYNLQRDNDTTLQRYPEILFTGLPLSLPATPLYFGWDSSYNNFNREKGVSGDRLDLDPHLVLPLKLGRNFLLQSVGGFRQTSYFNTSDGEGADDNRSFLHFQSELSTKLIKIYGNKNQQRRIRHTIEPEIIYTCIPNGAKEEVPRYDEVDRFQPQNRIAIALTNRFTAKYKRPDNTSYEKELLFLRIGEYYDATSDSFAALAAEDVARKAQEHGVKIFLEMRTRPANFWYIKSNLEYNVDTADIDLYNTALNFQDQRGDYLGFEYRYSKNIETLVERQTGLDVSDEKTDQINSRAGIQLWKELGLFFANSQDRLSGRSLYTLLGCKYSPQCWGSTLTVQKLPQFQGRKKETKIMVDFYLQGIGKVSGFGLSQ